MTKTVKESNYVTKTINF